MRLLRSLLLCFSALSLGALAVSTTFSNSDIYVFDTDGNALDSTSGKIHVINGLYVLYGISLGCGELFCGIQAWSSPDLKRWQSQGFLFDPNDSGNAAICAMNGNCGRPHVLYNDANKEYVLWVNAGTSGYQLFTSAQPYSGFTAVAQTAAVGYGTPATAVADFTVENINGTGYLVYSSIDYTTLGASIWPPFNQSMFVQQLSPDFKSTTGVAHHVLSNGDLVDYESESPDIFYRNGYYYITASNTCGYCTGTLLLLYRSKSITGPWTRQVLSGDTCGGQSDGIIPITTSSGTTYLHQSDLYGSSPFAAIRQSAHGFGFQPLSFKSDGSAADLDCSPSATFTVKLGKVGTQPAKKLGLAETATDSSGADAAYTQVCDTPLNSYYQTWTSSKSGTLKQVDVNLASTPFTDALTLTVFRFQNVSQLQSPHFIWETLGTAAYTSANLTQALENRSVLPNATVKKGDHLGLAIITPRGGDTPFCYLQTQQSSSSHVLLYNGANQVSYRGAQGKTSPVKILQGQELKWQSVVE